MDRIAFVFFGSSGKGYEELLDLESLLKEECPVESITIWTSKTLTKRNNQYPLLDEIKEELDAENTLVLPILASYGDEYRKLKDFKRISEPLEAFLPEIFNKLSAAYPETTDTAYLFISHGAEEEIYKNCLIRSDFYSCSIHDQIIPPVKEKNVVFIPFLLFAGYHIERDVKGRIKDYLISSGHSVSVVEHGLSKESFIRDIFIDNLHKLLDK